ncbi:MAG: NAD(P)-dependent oxidoreductase, partial [Myxococcota bacterium]
LCRLAHEEHGLATVVLRTARFFPEDDDTLRTPSGPNLKANEFLNRRLTVRDVARGHLAALERAPALGYAMYLLSAPTPFQRTDAQPLIDDVVSVIAHYFPDAPEIYKKRGWVLPERIERVYDSQRSRDLLGLDYETDFAAVLDALRSGAELPFEHDASYTSPRVTE